MKKLSSLLCAVLLFGCFGTARPAASQVAARTVAAALKKNLNVSRTEEFAIRVAFLTPIAMVYRYYENKMEKAVAKIAKINELLQAEGRQPTREEREEADKIGMDNLKNIILRGVAGIGYMGSYMFIDSQFNPITWGHWFARGFARLPAAAVVGTVKALCGTAPAKSRVGKLGAYVKYAGFTAARAAFGQYLERRWVDHRYGMVQPLTAHEKLLRVGQEALPLVIAKAVF